MKKVSYSLRIAIIGDKAFNEQIFLNNLRNVAIDSTFSEDIPEFFIVFNYVPIKIKVFLAESLELITHDYDKIEKLDVLILTANLYNPKSMIDYDKTNIEDFIEIFSFSGLSILAGMDVEKIIGKSRSNKLKISRYKLKNIARELNLIYCFEIYDKQNDITEIYDKVFSDFYIKFQYSNPELFEQAKIYGKELTK